MTNQSLPKYNGNKEVSEMSESPRAQFCQFFYAILRTVELENECLREMLKENGVTDEALQTALNQKTSNPQIQKRIDSMLAPAVKEMERLQKVVLREALALSKLPDVQRLFLHAYNRKWTYSGRSPSL